MNIRNMPFWLALLITFISCFGSVAYADDIVELQTHRASMIGKDLQYFQEDGTRLSIAQARERFQSGLVKDSSSDAISLGLGVKPVWLKTTIQNIQGSNQAYRFSVETPWLDYVDAFVVKNGSVVQVVSGGDAMAFEERPMQYRYFAFDWVFEKGTTEVYFRVESAGPMAIPIRLAKVEDAIGRDIRQGYEYGILYGIMLALAIYNLVLYLLIRLPEFGLYAAYLFGFVANSLSYTGQIHAVFTPDFGPYFQDWVDISLMVTYSVFGLHFARVLLKTKDYAPRLDKVTMWIANSIPVGMLLGAAINSLMFSMVLAFLLNTSFAWLFILLGYKALKARVKLAKFFFISSVTAAICICISTASVAGLVPYNDVTFKLIEVGMAVEALLLAVVLAYRFRIVQRGKEVAEFDARTDELTSLKNRRGFRDKADAVWSEMIQYNHDVSVVLIDIDKFKVINDTFGHAKGDVVIREVASRIYQTMRKTDISARWGGEEFILLLPDTDREQARFYAERLRKAVESDPIFSFEGEEVFITASLGVAGTHSAKFDNEPVSSLQIEKMISHADQALYSAKNSGRNQVRVYNAKLQPQAI